MSPDARKANLAWLEVLWQAYKKTVADLRGVTPEDIDHYANDFSGYLARVNGDTARMALDFGLVDELKTVDEVNEELRALVGEGANNAFKQIHFDQYLQHIAPRRRQIHPGRPKVGVIVARGIILDGSQPKGKIGGDGILALSNGRTVIMLVKGKFKKGQTQLSLKGDKLVNPLFGAVKFKLGALTFSNGTGDIVWMKAKAFGQGIAWP